MSRRLLTVLILAILVLAVFKLRSVDIRADVSSTEETVLSVLRLHGMTDEDVLFREEDEWKKSGIRGKTLNYVVKIDNVLKTAELAKEIKAIDSKAAKWIASDVIRELESEAVQKRLRK